MQLSNRLRSKLIILLLILLTVFWLFIDPIMASMGGLVYGQSLVILILKIATYAGIVTLAYVALFAIFNNVELEDKTLVVKVGNDKIGNSIVFLGKTIVLASLIGSMTYIMGI